MILIFGGTTEGRVAAKVCNGASKPFFYSTKSEGQTIEAANILRLYGAMSHSEIVGFCQREGIKLLIDAAHPFAVNLHANIMEAATQLEIPLIRFERQESTPNHREGIISCSSLREAIEEIQRRGYRRLLALTGVKSSKELAALASTIEVRLRIMDREESWRVARESGFPLDKLVVYGLCSDLEMMEEAAADVILLKESGQSGGTDSKIELAQRLGVDVVVITRPTPLHYKSVVYGAHGLRHAIDRALPEFFSLATGFTTGSCATAAAVVALRAILLREQCEYVGFTLPCGERVTMSINNIERSENWARASVVKDGGDDPDVTNGAVISAEVRVDRNAEGITITGGDGVGRVTLPGLGLEVGQSAINPVPREMIRENILREIKELSIECGVEVVISVEDGAEIAQRTFNPRLGVVGGISILGTSGMVQPFSREAFLDSISRHIDVVKALGHETIVINSGGKSERFLKAHYTDLAGEQFVQYGNMIGDTLKLCAAGEFRQVILGVMIGKAVKLAEGYLDTHSKRGVMNREFIAKVAQGAGCSKSTLAKIEEITTANELWEIIPPGEQRSFFDSLKECCYEHCQGEVPHSKLKIILVRDSRLY